MRIALPILLSTTTLIGVAGDGSAHAQAPAVAAVEGPLTAVAYVEVKAASAEAAVDVTDLAMVACGGAAFRKELGIERRFRDARAARVMAPTTQALHDIVGRALTGLPLLGDVTA